MLTVNSILIVLAMILAMVLVCAWLNPKRTAKFRNACGPVIGLANIAEGTHERKLTKKTDAAVGTRYLLAKFGTDVDHVNICGAADVPIGVMDDEAAAAEELINVNLLNGPQTQLMVASAAIALGALVEPAAGGKIQTLGAGAGTHHIVGRALNAAAADGDLVEVDSFYCLRVI